MRSGDADFLLKALREGPQPARFAVAQALERVGGTEALEPLLSLLGDPYSQREASQASARIALRCGARDRALAALREPGLGAGWRWVPRALLGDPDWVRALQAAWPTLGPGQRLQALEAARDLPEPLRRQVRDATAGASGALLEVWRQL